jgi:hypothetical protein
MCYRHSAQGVSSWAHGFSHCRHGWEHWSTACVAALRWLGSTLSRLVYLACRIRWGLCVSVSLCIWRVLDVSSNGSHALSDVAGGHIVDDENLVQNCLWHMWICVLHHIWLCIVYCRHNYVNELHLFLCIIALVLGAFSLVLLSRKNASLYLCHSRYVY